MAHIVSDDSTIKMYDSKVFLCRITHKRLVYFDAHLKAKSNITNDGLYNDKIKDIGILMLCCIYVFLFKYLG